MTDKPSVIINNVPPSTPRSNGLGVAGFVVSLVGLVFCMGILCPIGLILSACGMRKEPKGLAIAGMIIGLIGTITTVAIVSIFGLGVFTTCASCAGLSSAITTAAKQNVTTNDAINTARQKIDDYYTAHAHTLPADADGNIEISTLSDGWNHNLRYSKMSPTQFEIRSAGPDGRFGTFDDISRVFTETMPESQP